MTTTLIGIKKTKSDLTFTKAKQIPNCLTLLTDPLVNKKMKIIASCNDGNLNKLITSSFTSTSTSTSTSSIIPFTSNFTSISSSISTSNSTFKVDKKHKKAIKKYNNHIKNLDLGFVIPLNVDKNIEGLQKKIKTYKKNISNYPINNYFRINNTKNNFIYQLINNELYVLSIIIKDFFNKDTFFKEKRNQLFQKITNNLNYIANNFKNIIINLNTKNLRNTYTIYGGCMTMQGHNKYNLPTTEEKYCHVAKFIQNYIQEHSINFEKIKSKSNLLYNYFQNSKEFHQEVDIGKTHFQEILKSQDIYEFYLYLKDELFSSIINLESMIKNLIKINFSELYDDFNINLPGIETNLLFFKSFAINFSIPGNNDILNIKRQGATDPHTDKNDCKYTFCVIIVFGDFEEGELVLSQIGIIIEIKCGYIILLRSSLLEHFNLHVLNNRFSIVYYLKKTFYNEV